MFWMLFIFVEHVNVYILLCMLKVALILFVYVNVYIIFCMVRSRLFLLFMWMFIFCSSVVQSVNYGVGILRKLKSAYTVYVNIHFVLAVRQVFKSWTLCKGMFIFSMLCNCWLLCIYSWWQQSVNRCLSEYSYLACYVTAGCCPINSWWQQTTVRQTISLSQTPKRETWSSCPQKGLEESGTAGRHLSSKSGSCIFVSVFLWFLFHVLWGLISTSFSAHFNPKST